MNRQEAKLARRRRRKARHTAAGSTKRRRPTRDTGDLIAYGARCSWYDDKANVGTIDGRRTGLPCCPVCGGVLYEVERHAWDLAVTEHGIYPTFADRPDYPELVAWGRGRCFLQPIDLFAAWLEHMERARADALHREAQS